jgi:hypothetical protein
MGVNGFAGLKRFVMLPKGVMLFTREWNTVPLSADH